MTEKKLRQKNCKPHEWCEHAGPGVWECHKCEKPRPKNFMADLKYQVEDCLFRFPASRDSDIVLTQMIWINHWGQYVHLDGGAYWIKLEDLDIVPTQDDIKRWRAKVQNDEERFVPTKWEVAKARKMKEEVWKRALGYSVDSEKVESTQEQLL